MAFKFPPRLIRPGLLSCSPARQHIRPSCFPIGRLRTSQLRRDACTLSSGLEVCAEMFNVVHHAAGAPWVLAIPIVALGVRTISIPVVHVLLHMKKVREAPTTTFARALSHQLAVDASRERHIDHPSRKLMLTIWHSLLDGKYGSLRVRRRLYWTAAVTQVSLWLVMSETLRCMIGMHYGLFGMLLAGIGLAPTPTGPSSMFHGQLCPHLIQPSIATEGILWFSDLTVPDPTACLSVVFAGLSFLAFKAFTTVRYDPYNPATTYSRLMSKRQKLAYYALKTRPFLPYTSILILPLTIKVPAALLLYWITSMASAMLVNKALRGAMPLPKVVTPCVRGFEGTRGAATWLKYLDDDVEEVPERKKTKQSSATRRPWDSGS
jgi:mitochondrial inner membrane protein COX18